MQQNSSCLFRKSCVFPVVLCLILILPAFVCAQMKIPASKLPGGVQTPQKEIKIDKQQMLSVYYSVVKVEAVQLWPADCCNGTWQARISNPQNFNIGKSLAIPYQYLAVYGKWMEGPAVEFNLEKNQKVTVQGQWSRKLLGDKFKVAFKPLQAGVTYDEKIIDFPPIGNPSLVIERFEIGDKYVAAHIKNTGQVPGCDLIVQKYTAKNSSPDNFSPAGGKSCDLPANATTVCKSFVDVEKWKQGWDIVKIVVFGRNNTVFAERIFPIQ